MAQAMGQPEALKAVTFNAGSDLLEAIAGAGSGKRHVEQVAAEKFTGSVGAKPKSPPTHDQLQKTLGGLPDPQVDGDTATTAPIGGKIIRLKNQGGKWRVDGVSFIGSLPQQSQKAAIVSGLRAQARASESIAQEINAGKYADWAGAQKA